MAALFRVFATSAELPTQPQPVVNEVALTLDDNGFHRYTPGGWTLIGALSLQGLFETLGVGATQTEFTVNTSGNVTASEGDVSLGPSGAIVGKTLGIGTPGMSGIPFTVSAGGEVQAVAGNVSMTAAQGLASEFGAALGNDLRMYDTGAGIGTTRARYGQGGFTAKADAVNNRIEANGDGIKLGSGAAPPVQVIGNQAAAIPDIGLAPSAQDVADKVNVILAMLRTHGLIAT